MIGAYWSASHQIRPSHCVYMAEEPNFTYLGRD